MKKITTIITVILFYCVQVNSMDTTSIKYYPLNVGNIYVYKTVESYLYWSHTSYGKVIFTKDSIMHGHKYFYYSGGTQYWCRTDSNSGSLYIFDSSTICHVNQYDKLIDSLGMRSGSYNCWGLYVNCAGESNITMFGIPTTNLTFGYFYGNQSRSWSYAKYFGFVYSSLSGGTGAVTTTLEGCIINGVLYGDTSMYVGIKNINSEAPVKYILFQNYPNPFNPATIIKFQIQRLADLKIAVYDITGKELTTLADKEYKAGTYEVTFDGTNYSSGIYFYSLFIDGKLIETKRMILLK